MHTHRVVGIVQIVSNARTHSLIPVEVFINSEELRGTTRLSVEVGKVVALPLSIELKLPGFIEASPISFNGCLSPIECSNTHVWEL